jgi:hypothetical protein
MREDYIEQLDKMFPDGYAIVYTCEDGQTRFSHYCPTENGVIQKFWELAKDINDSAGRD